MNQKSRGFSLIELMLVLSITIGAIIASMESLREEAEIATANAAADHIKAVGEATTSYVLINSKSLANSPSTTINVSTLRAANLLSSAYVNTNSWGSDYQIFIKRMGSAPPFSFESIIVTLTPITIDGVARIDIAARAANFIGAQAGYAMDTNAISGVGAGWVITPGSYAGLEIKEAKLAYHIDYSRIKSLDSSLVRMDGGNSMLAALNMGGNELKQANKLDAVNSVGSKQIQASSIIVAGNAATKEASLGSLTAQNLSIRQYLFAGSLAARNFFATPTPAPPPSNNVDNGGGE